MQRRYNETHKTKKHIRNFRWQSLTRNYKSKDEIISGSMIPNECNILVHILHSVPKRTEHTAHSFSSVFQLQTAQHAHAHAHAQHSTYINGKLHYMRQGLSSYMSYYKIYKKGSVTSSQLIRKKIRLISGLYYTAQSNVKTSHNTLCWLRHVCCYTTVDTSTAVRSPCKKVHTFY